MRNIVEVLHQMFSFTYHSMSIVNADEAGLVTLGPMYHSHSPP